MSRFLRAFRLQQQGAAPLAPTTPPVGGEMEWRGLPAGTQEITAEALERRHPTLQWFRRLLGPKGPELPITTAALFERAPTFEAVTRPYARPGARGVLGQAMVGFGTPFAAAQGALSIVGGEIGKALQGQETQFWRKLGKEGLGLVQRTLDPAAVPHMPSEDVARHVVKELGFRDAIKEGLRKFQPETPEEELDALAEGIGVGLWSTFTDPTLALGARGDLSKIVRTLSETATKARGLGNVAQAAKIEGQIARYQTSLDRLNRLADGVKGGIQTVGRVAADAMTTMAEARRPGFRRAGPPAVAAGERGGIELPERPAVPEAPVAAPVPERPPVGAEVPPRPAPAGAERPGGLPGFAPAPTIEVIGPKMPKPLSDLADIVGDQETLIGSRPDHRTIFSKALEWLRDAAERGDPFVREWAPGQYRVEAPAWGRFTFWQQAGHPVVRWSKEIPKTLLEQVKEAPTQERIADREFWEQGKRLAEAARTKMFEPTPPRETVPPPTERIPEPPVPTPPREPELPPALRFVNVRGGDLAPGDEFTISGQKYEVEPTKNPAKLRIVGPETDRLVQSGDQIPMDEGSRRPSGELSLDDARERAPFEEEAAVGRQEHAELVLRLLETNRIRPEGVRPGLTPGQVIAANRLIRTKGGDVSTIAKGLAAYFVDAPGNKLLNFVIRDEAGKVRAIRGLEEFMSVPHFMRSIDGVVIDEAAARLGPPRGAGGMERPSLTPTGDVDEMLDVLRGIAEADWKPVTVRRPKTAAEAIRAAAEAPPLKPEPEPVTLRAAEGPTVKEVADAKRQPARTVPAGAEPSAEPGVAGVRDVAGGVGGRGAGRLPGPAGIGTVLTVRPNLTARVDASGIAPRVSQHLTDAQQQGVAKALAAMDRPKPDGGFLLSDGTGVGKTRQELAVAQTYADRGAPVLIVTKAEVLKAPDGVIRGSFRDDAAAMGVEITSWLGPNRPRDPVLTPGRIHVTNYSQIHQVAQAITPETVLILDESHAAKNLDATRQGAVIMGAVERAKSVLFASATPYDKPYHIEYLARTGILEGMSAQEAYRKMGLRLQRIPGSTQQRWVIAPHIGAEEAYRRLSGVFERLTAAGQTIKREIGMDGVDVRFRTIPLPAEAHRTMALIEQAGLPKRMVRIHQRLQQEPYKIAESVRIAEAELGEGRQVVLFIQRVNMSEVGVWRRGPGGERFREIIHASEGTAASLKAALEERGVRDIAEMHGGADMTGGEAMERFQSGRAKVLIATIESGGTGINLDDRVGNAPRTMIVVTAPFSAVPAVQAAGRIWRLTTKSNPRIYWLFGDTNIDRVNASILGTKMKTLKAVVSGDVSVLDVPEEILEAMGKDIEEALEIAAKLKPGERVPAEAGRPPTAPEAARPPPRTAAEAIRAAALVPEPRPPEVPAVPAPARPPEAPAPPVAGAPPIKPPRPPAPPAAPGPPGAEPPEGTPPPPATQSQAAAFGEKAPRVPPERPPVTAAEAIRAAAEEPEWINLESEKLSPGDTWMIGEEKWRAEKGIAPGFIRVVGPDGTGADLGPGQVVVVQGGTLRKAKPKAAPTPPVPEEAKPEDMSKLYADLTEAGPLTDDFVPLTEARAPRPPEAAPPAAPPVLRPPAAEPAPAPPVRPPAGAVPPPTPPPAKPPAPPAGPPTPSPAGPPGEPAPGVWTKTLKVERVKDVRDAFMARSAEEAADLLAGTEAARGKERINRQMAELMDDGTVPVESLPAVIEMFGTTMPDFAHQYMTWLKQKYALTAGGALKWSATLAGQTLNVLSQVRRWLNREVLKRGPVRIVAEDAEGRTLLEAVVDERGARRRVESLPQEPARVTVSGTQPGPVRRHWSGSGRAFGELDAGQYTDLFVSNRDALRVLQELGEVELTWWQHVKYGGARIQPWSWWPGYVPISRASIRLMIAGVPTQIRNAEAGVANALWIALDRAIEGRLGGRPEGNRVALEMVSAMIGHVAKADRRAQFDRVMRTFPYLAAQLGVGDPGRTGAVAAAATLGEKFMNLVTTPARLQENWSRNFGADAMLRSIIAERGVDVAGTRVTGQGAVREAYRTPSIIPESYISEAVEAGLDVSAALVKKGDRLGNVIAGMYRAVPMLDTIYAFPRFFAWTYQKLLEHNPLGALALFWPGAKRSWRDLPAAALVGKATPEAKARFAEITSKALTGTVLLAGAYALREYMGGDKWYKIKVGDKQIDMRPFAPFAQYLFFAELLRIAIKSGKHWANGAELQDAVRQEWNISWADAIQGVLPINRIAGTSLVLIEMLRPDINPDTAADYVASFIGQYLARFTVPFNQIRLLLAGAGVEEEAVVRAARTGPEALPEWAGRVVGPAMVNVPGVARALPALPSPFRAEPRTIERPLTRGLVPPAAAIETIHPVESEAASLGLTEQEFRGRVGVADVDLAVTQRTGELAERVMPGVIGREKYRALSLPERKFVFRKIMMALRRQAVREIAAENPEMARAMAMERIPKEKIQMLRGRALRAREEAQAR